METERKRKMLHAPLIILIQLIYRDFSSLAHHDDDVCGDCGTHCEKDIQGSSLSIDFFRVEREKSKADNWYHVLP